MEKKKRLHLSRITWLLCFGVFGGVLFLTKAFWLPIPALLLFTEDPLSRSDAIVVLGGNAPARLPKAASLYKEGYAPIVLVGGDYYHDTLLSALGEFQSSAELNSKMLSNFGVPAEAVISLGKAGSTYEEALHVKEYIGRRKSINSIIIVSSNFQSRRAKWVFKKVLKKDGVRVSAVEAEDKRFLARNWWQHEDGLVSLFNEYLKFGYYVINY